jgi:ubiquinone/menaquinone biosynthesis C-methylase UbiE
MNADVRLDSVRSTYDAVAESYARLLPDASFEAPADHGMISAFVAHVTEGNAQSVVDAGCGTGRMTLLLASLGVDVSGIELSPGMISVARRNYPELSFAAARLSELPFADMQLGGVFAWYSIIHSPPEELPRVFAEFFRVLAPGGHALLSFQVGEGHRHVSRAYGHDVSLETWLFTPETIAGLLTDAGFSVTARMTRQARAQENTPQAVLLAHRPSDQE